MLAVLSLLLTAAPAAADPGYEDRLLTWGLQQQERELEPNPDGKKIEEILVSAEEIITPGDFFPRLLNYLHMRTREGPTALTAPGPDARPACASQDRACRA